MKYKNYKAYDDNDFFNKYIAKRKKGNSPNETIEKPIIDELIQSVEGKVILDLGCGDGKYGKELLQKGAQFYHGIEGSSNMYQLALKNLPKENTTVEHQDIEQHNYAEAKYDLVLSRLVFHYIENLESLFNQIHKSLKLGGELIFSIEHPVITSCYKAYNDKSIKKRQHWIVDDYFKSGERVNIWIEKEVIKFHKSLEEYFQIIKNTNFELLDLRESKPQKKHFKSEEDYQRRMRVPLFLILKLKK